MQEHLDLILAAYIAAQLLDVATTLRGMKRGLREANPIVARLMEHGALWIVVKLGLAGAIGVYLYQQGAAGLLLAVAAVTLGLAINNHRLTR